MDLREKYDTSNPVIAKIIQAKEERLKILQELNKDLEDDLPPLTFNIEESIKKKKTPARKRFSEKLPRSEPVRRSGRLSAGNNQTSYLELKDDFEDSPKTWKVRPPRIRPANDYGPMPEIDVGHHWETRMECSYDGVHRPTVAGIHAGPEGAYSIALSGGYPEDVDEGHSFTYTGAGGRDLKGTASNPKNLRTAPQTKDQELTGVNYSLVRSIETGRPIRVIRGYKSTSIFAPETGYRYDGLYNVVRYWEDVGKTGFRIYRFEMVRLKDQDPPPWETENENKVPEKKRRSKGTIDYYLTDKSNTALQNGEVSSTSDVYESSSNGKESSDEDNLLNRDDILANSLSIENEFDCGSLTTDEVSVDEEIDACCKRMLEMAKDLSSVAENLKDDSEDSGFYGWE